MPPAGAGLGGSARFGEKVGAFTVGWNPSVLPCWYSALRAAARFCRVFSSSISNFTILALSSSSCTRLLRNASSCTPSLDSSCMRAAVLAASARPCVASATCFAACSSLRWDGLLGSALALEADTRRAVAPPTPRTAATSISCPTSLRDALLAYSTMSSVVPATARAAEMRPCAQAGSRLYTLALLGPLPLAVSSRCTTVALSTSTLVARVMARAASMMASAMSCSSSGALGARSRRGPASRSRAADASMDLAASSSSFSANFCRSFCSKSSSSPRL
mmetsp:Transcript_33864/g.85003  ORF Transcript_33864/g.85003 Transcript_33864/m.85003 type:complete len:277 (-) Transcript_33864:2896-3726(-)